MHPPAPVLKQPRHRDNAVDDAAHAAVLSLLGINFKAVHGEPDGADALALIEDGEAIAKIGDKLLTAWAVEAASSLPGNYRESLAALRDTFATALSESDFMAQLNAAREQLDEYHDERRADHRLTYATAAE